VADYRGYGRSGGVPNFSRIAGDSHPIFRYFRDLVRASPKPTALFVMGRSLGSESALELAAHYPGDLKGLILESGSPNPGRLLRRFNIAVPSGDLEELDKAVLERMKSITLPVLVIHGESDELIPVRHAIDFYENVGSGDKKLVIIPGAGHNDIMLVGMEQYLSAVGEFVHRHAG